MTKFIGRRVAAELAKETSRGGGPAANTKYGLPFDTFSFDDKVDEAVRGSGIGRIEMPEQAHVIGKYAEGDFEGELRDKSFGLLLLALYGSVSTSAPAETSVYTHTFTVDNSAQHDSLSLKVIDPNQTRLYKLLMLNTLKINVTLDDVITFAANFISKVSSTSSGTITYTAENKYTRKHVSIRVADTTSALSSATDLSVKSMTINYNQNLVRDNVMGTISPEDILNQQMVIDGELTLNYEDQTWKDYMLDGTTKALRMRATNSDVTIGSTLHPYIDLQFDKVSFFDWAPDRGLDDIVSQTISFRANYDLTNSSQSQAVLVNTATAY
jgi:hypothetical protein